MIKWLDNKLYKYLLRKKDKMPMRFIKWIAYFYTDARVRKVYWEKLNVYMGENSYPPIGMMVVNSEKTQVIVGNNVSLAPYVTFVAETAANNGKKINDLSYVKTHITKSLSIIISDEVWIGANVTLMPGVRVGECSVIGAGSVVTRDIEPYSIYAGVPARKIRTLDKEG